jgi:hypothetical protein
MQFPIKQVVAPALLPTKGYAQKWNIKKVFYPIHFKYKKELLKLDVVIVKV